MLINVISYSSLSLFKSIIKLCLLFELVYRKKFHDQIEACNDEKYGMNCRFDCSSHCLDSEVCNKTDGSCRSCADGYTGIKCDTGRLYRKLNFINSNWKYFINYKIVLLICRYFLKNVTLESMATPVLRVVEPASIPLAVIT